LVQTARQSSSTAEFLQILEDWKATYFTGNEAEKEFWEGTAYQLYKAISPYPQAEPAMRNYSIAKVNRALAALKNNGAPIECHDEETKRIWRIYRPGAEPSQADILPLRHI
jgi:hypothetical protein